MDFKYDDAIIMLLSSKPRLLVVDDDRDCVLCLRATLELKGFQVDIFTQPQDALGHLSVGKYDLVILDVNMPGMTGFELAREINRKDGNAKVILMTGFEIDKKEFEKVMPSTRVDAFVKKPVTVTKLLDHIGALTGYGKVKDDRDLSLSSISAAALSSIMVMPSSISCLLG